MTGCRYRFSEAEWCPGEQVREFLRRFAKFVGPTEHRRVKALMMAKSKDVSRQPIAVGQMTLDEHRVAVARQSWQLDEDMLGA